MKKYPASTYKTGEQDKITSEFLRNKLKLKSLEAKSSLSKKYPHVEKFFQDRGVDLSRIRKHSAKIISTGALTGTLLFAPPGLSSLPTASEVARSIDGASGVSRDLGNDPAQKTLINLLGEYLPEKVGPLDRRQEKALEKVFDEVVGVKTRANLEGEHLNTTYGYIGAEQHLMRYPGDTMSTHPAIPVGDEGMAPGRGAWGYFARSKDQLNEDLIEKEKWYAVVQTLYLSDWSDRQPYLRDWYKYRKVLIVNTKNGNAVVADIADAGPAAWTGKHFGGSPEVMNYLGGPRYKKGPVIIFFVDDPENKVPLGPVEYNKVQISGVELKQI
ncbi:MAG: hypothetical protein ACHQUA_01395 [Microgenomates group bacterium]